MLNARYKQNRATQRKAKAPLGRPGARPDSPSIGRAAGVRSTVRSAAASHPLCNGADNAHLYDYERSVQESFDGIVPSLKKISALQHESGFVSKAQRIAESQLGFSLPGVLLDNAWVDQLDMRSLFAWSVFETYHRFCDDVFSRDPLANNSDEAFQALLEECGFHTLDVSPCADGRLALSLIHISEPTRRNQSSRMPSSA